MRRAGRRATGDSPLIYVRKREKRQTKSRYTEKERKRQREREKGRESNRERAPNTLISLGRDLSNAAKIELEIHIQRHRESVVYVSFPSNK